VATGTSFTEYGKHFDTISVCLSKGLGAPVGSILISNKERIAEARIWRKRYGAGMRQIGILAAAGHYALDNNIARLADDHRRAKKLAIAANLAAPMTIDPDTVETNIVALDLTELKISAQELNAQLKSEGVLASALGPNFLRLVTHLDFSDSDLEKAIEVLSRLLKRALVA
jgi:threonine aldolase